MTAPRRACRGAPPGRHRTPTGTSRRAAYTACGRYDDFWEIGLSRWDIAAGILKIKDRVTEAWGQRWCRRRRGARYRCRAFAFAEATGVDAMAISVGNVHLQQESSAGLDETRIAAIEEVTDVPLVIHGGSGVPHAQRTHLARHTAIC